MNGGIRPRHAGSEREGAMKVLFVSYGFLLATGLIHAFVFDAMFGNVVEIDDGVRTNMLLEMLVVEAIDTVVILIVLSLGISPPPQNQPSRNMKLGSWLAAMPILSALLAVNYGYHWLLRHFTGLPLISDELNSQIDFLALLVICIQPAVVEEAYCRWFALNCLLSATGTQAAVWLSATMFGFLHVADLPSVPYLIFLGGVLAYLRLASGTLILPVIIHFLHNLLIMLLPG